VIVDSTVPGGPEPMDPVSKGVGLLNLEESADMPDPMGPVTAWNACPPHQLVWAESVARASAAPGGASCSEPGEPGPERLGAVVLGDGGPDEGGGPTAASFELAMRALKPSRPFGCGCKFGDIGGVTVDGGDVGVFTGVPTC